MNGHDGPGINRSTEREKKALSNALSGALDGNPFVGEGGAYNSVRPAYPDEAVAALVATASSYVSGVSVLGREIFSHHLAK